MVDQDPFVSMRDWILTFLGVSERFHKLGGREFQVGGFGFVHSHGPSLLDLRLSKEDQSRVLHDGVALPHRAAIHDQQGWVSFRIEKGDDIEEAKLLVRLAYENAKKTVETLGSETK